MLRSPLSVIRDDLWPIRVCTRNRATPLIAIRDAKVCLRSSLPLLQRARLAEDQLRARARELAALVIGAHAPVHPWRDCCAKLIFTRIASGSALRETV